jgi:hypothetical protein
MGTKFTMVGRRTSLSLSRSLRLLCSANKKYSTTAPKGKSTSQVQCQYLARFCRKPEFWPPKVERCIVKQSHITCLWANKKEIDTTLEQWEEAILR